MPAADSNSAAIYLILRCGSGLHMPSVWTRGPYGASTRGG